MRDELKANIEDAEGAEARPKKNYRQCAHEIPQRHPGLLKQIRDSIAEHGATVRSKEN
jgi:hypothetical protein